jgi:uncharacterized protein
MMLPSDNSIAKTRPADPALDQEFLLQQGLAYIRDLSRYVWTDYNLHDPGVTIVELLSYALTDMAYRASQPVEDLVAQATGKLFHTAKEILPSAPVSLTDLRKLFIDIPEVNNAWILPVTKTLFTDGKNITPTRVNQSDCSLSVKGLYNICVDSSVPLAAVKEKVLRQYAANRALCESVVNVTTVPSQPFLLCSRIMLDPAADEKMIAARILFEVGKYLSPVVRRYSLSQMYAKGYTTDQVFEGPALQHGFIDDRELLASELRKEIRLSDIIGIISDIPGILAIEEIRFNPAALGIDEEDNGWTWKARAGFKPVLDIADTLSRLTFYKGIIPIYIDAGAETTAVMNNYTQLSQQYAAANITTIEEPEFPVGKDRQPGNYYSFQNHFPPVYGIGMAGLPATATTLRQAQAKQLKAYLLLFDQLMANYLRELNAAGELLSLNSDTATAFFAQKVTTLSGVDELYVDPANVAAQLEMEMNGGKAFPVRHALLDHMIARFAENFSQYAHTIYAAMGKDTAVDKALLQDKAYFLEHYAESTYARGEGYNITGGNYWNSKLNSAGFEKRIASLLGMDSLARRDLSPLQGGQEGLYVVENLLLLPPDKSDGIYLPVCDDCAKGDCGCYEPYSYRVHIILPAYAERFRKMAFRTLAEAIIREETPAHIMPKICWISEEQMQLLQVRYKAWIEMRADDTKFDKKIHQDFINILFDLNSIYPESKLISCSDDTQDKFILDNNILGTEPKE